MLFTRKLLNPLIEQIERPEIIILTGMRRVGKTTLLQMVYEYISSSNKLFLDFENPLDQSVFAENDFNNIFVNLSEMGLNPSEKSYVFIDEIQNRPQTVHAIKFLYDHYPIKFFLTGSSSFYLKNLFPESLAGRKFNFELFPLDFEEFMRFKGQHYLAPTTFVKKNAQVKELRYERYKKLVDEFLTFGGFPQVVLESKVEYKKRILSDIFTSYFEKEVYRLADFKKKDRFKSLLLLLMERCGSKLDVSKLSSLVGVSRDTIYSYLHFLQGSYFISLISPFNRNRDRQVSGARKVYFCDNGLLNLFSRVGHGQLLENAVYNSLCKVEEPLYYQTRAGLEIDFILVEQNVAFEVKQTATPQDYKKLLRLADKLNIKTAYLIGKNFKPIDGLILFQDL